MDNLVKAERFESRNWNNAVYETPTCAADLYMSETVNRTDLNGMGVF